MKIRKFYLFSTRERAKHSFRQKIRKLKNAVYSLRNLTYFYQTGPFHHYISLSDIESLRGYLKPNIEICDDDISEENKAYFIGQFREAVVIDRRELNKLPLYQDLMEIEIGD